MTYALIRDSIAAVLLVGVGVSQFLKALGNLRRGGRTAKGKPVRRWTDVAAMIVCLCFILVGVNLFARSMHLGVGNDILLELAFIPFGIAMMAIGLWWVKSGVWNGIIQQRLASGSGVLDRSNSLIMGVVILLLGLGFMFGGFVLLFLVLGPKPA
jgi:hypothetical protein